MGGGGGALVDKLLGIIIVYSQTTINNKIAF